METEDIRKTYLPQGGHRCDNKNDETKEIVKMLTTLSFECNAAFREAQNEEAINMENINLSSENKIVMKEVAQVVVNFLNFFKDVDLRNISAEDLDVHLGSSSSKSPNEEPKKEAGVVAGSSIVKPISCVAPAPPAPRYQRQIPLQSVVVTPYQRGNPRYSRDGGRLVQRPSLPAWRGSVRGSVLKSFVRERIDTKPVYKNWNGPGMKMLPELYGAALHEHRKYAPVDEKWLENSPPADPDLPNPPAPASNGSKNSNNGAGNVISIPTVYEEVETVKTVSKERQRITAIVQRFQISELAVAGSGVNCYTFVRSTGERDKIVIIIMSLSWYMWKDNLEENVRDKIAFKNCNLGSWLTNPTGAKDIIASLKGLSKQNVRDLLLTSLRNYDKIQEIDMELGKVLEVLHFNWKNPMNNAELM